LLPSFWHRTSRSCLHRGPHASWRRKIDRIRQAVDFWI